MNMTAFEPMLQDKYILKQNCVDIWQISLEHQLEGMVTLLTQAERARANRFYFPRHRRRFIVAHSTLRTIIGKYLNIPPQKVNFTENPYGKPELVHPTAKLYFNLSHSQDLALIAIGDAPLGVDLEFFSARPYIDIARKLFSSDEISAFQTIPSTLKPNSFFHVWAQKEAFIKACGLGLTYPTQQITLPILPPTDLQIYDALHNTTWHLRSFMPQLACCAAVCYAPQVEQIRYGIHYF